MTDFYSTTTPILFGVVIFFLTSCSSLSLKKENSNPKESSLSEEALVEKITSLDEQIKSSPANADLLYQKGYLLGELAQTKQEPSGREQNYLTMHQALNQAKDLFMESNIPLGKQKVDDLLKVRWSNEHNLGVQIIQNDSSLSENDFQRATAHFNNATIILPDTAISYRMKARAHYKNNDIPKAIATLEKAESHISKLPADILEQLAFLYLENDQESKAVTIYEEANSFSEDNLNIIHGLTNAYIKVGNHSKAVELLNILIENDSENIIYRQTLGTELYLLASEKLNTIYQPADSLKINQTLHEVDSLLIEAESQYKNVLSENLNSEAAKKTLVSFYQNSASKYQKLLNANKAIGSLDIETKISTFLEKSIPLYQSLLESNPTNKEIQETLFTTYTYLGMKNKADELKTNLQ